MTPPATPPVRTAIRVEGIVQGVGFRPFVYALATGLGLSGFVGNDVDGVFAEVEGPLVVVTEFLRQLERSPPPLARIERVTATAVTPTGETSFAIAASGPPGTRRTLVSADTATCDDCLRELSDPADRREEALLSIVPRNRRRGYDMRTLVRLVVDDGDLFEIQPNWGGSLITALTRLGGHAVGVLANNPLVRAGAMDAAAAEKTCKQ